MYDLWTDALGTHKQQLSILDRYYERWGDGAPRPVILLQPVGLGLYQCEHSNVS